MQRPPALSYLAIEDERVDAARKRVHDAEEEVAKLITGRHQPGAAAVDAKVIFERARNYRAAAVMLHQAAERYWAQLGSRT